MFIKKNTLKSIIFSTVAASALLTTTQSQASADPILGEIMWVGFTYCPRGFSEANGQLLQVAQNSALFSLYGTTYGGDGRTTFGLPDLRGRSPVHTGQGPGLSNIKLGQRGGAETVILTTNQISSHNHTATLHGTTNDGNADSPTGAVQAKARRSGVYSSDSANTDMAASSISVGNNGGSQAHENRSPYIAIRACVAIVGTYPSRN